MPSGTRVAAFAPCWKSALLFLVGVMAGHNERLNFLHHLLNDLLHRIFNFRRNVCSRGKVLPFNPEQKQIRRELM